MRSPETIDTAFRHNVLKRMAWQLIASIQRMKAALHDRRDSRSTYVLAYQNAAHSMATPNACSVFHPFIRG